MFKDCLFQNAKIKRLQSEKNSKTQRFTIFEKGCNGQNIHQSNTLGHDSLTVLQCVKHFEVVEYWHNLMPSSSSVRHC